MKRWHALAACVVAALALAGFRAWSNPTRPGPRSAPRTARHGPPATPSSAEAEGAPADPATVPEAPSSPVPATVVAVVAPATPNPLPEPSPVPDTGEDATEAWMRIVAPELTDEEKAAVDRHLTRFVRPPSGARAEARGVVLLPKADPDAAEKRRIEQLELLRQRKAIKLLDHIGQGLAWLALHQGPDGRLANGSAAARCKELGHEPACAETVGRASDDWAATAATGLAIIAMLDFRDQDKQGIFEPTLARAVTWLRGQQRGDGLVPGRAHYATAISLIALGQAAASSGSDDLRTAVQRGLACLANERGLDGGYRYQTAEPGDLSVTAWVAQAAEAARRAKIEVPPELDAGLRRFFDGVWLGEHRFSYLVGQGERPSLDPAGMLLGLILDPPAADGSWVRAGVLERWRLWLKDAPRKGIERGPYLYTLYYSVRVVIALEPELPEAWQRAILDLASRQNPSGPAAGSFRDTLGAGATLGTALSVLTLEHALYKR